MPAASALPLADRAFGPTSDKKSGQQSLLILAVITLAGAWLRLSHLGAQSLWLDEGATVALARASWQHFTWVWWHGEASLQTIYFLLMRGWIHLGSSEAWVRSLSAIFGIASIPMMYVVARKFTGVTWSLAAAGLLAFNPTHVYYSQEARSYSLAMFLVLVSTYFFVSAVDDGRARDWVWWTVFSAAAFYSHDFVALVLVAQAASLFFKAPPVPWRRMIVCGAIVLVAAIPALTYVLRASPENLYFIWMPRPSLKEFWHLMMFLGSSGVKVVLSLVLWGAGVAVVIRARRDGRFEDAWRGALLVLWAVLPILILALVSLRRPMFLQRYVVFSLPATVLLAAVGASILTKWRSGLVLVVALCVANVPSILNEYHKPREDWRGATATVLSSAAPGDAVVFFPFYTRIMMDYYASRHAAPVPAVHIFAPAYYDGGEEVRNLLQALGSNPHAFQHVWILMADHGTRLEIFDHGAETQQKLQEIYGDPRVYRFADIDVLEYGK
jgi:4-amino-4-deoxy-L-arabinose transferase-like glycosyltransferase